MGVHTHTHNVTSFCTSLHGDSYSDFRPCNTPLLPVCIFLHIAIILCKCCLWIAFTDTETARLCIYDHNILWLSLLLTRPKLNAQQSAQKQTCHLGSLSAVVKPTSEFNRQLSHQPKWTKLHWQTSLIQTNQEHYCAVPAPLSKTEPIRRFPTFFLGKTTEMHACWW